MRTRAGGLCEYCQLPDSVHPAPFQIDHVVAKQHGGSSTSDNLAWACIHCNRHKGPNIAGFDPETGKLSRLFNPRADKWADHFRWGAAMVVPLSPVGRVTITVLFMNDPEVVSLRQALGPEVFPGDHDPNPPMERVH